MKFSKLMAATILLLSSAGVSAQETRELSLHDLFQLADSQNTDIKAAESAISASKQGEKVARNAMLPQIEASLSLSYLGDGTILDRDLSHAMRDRLPHFSNSLGVELYQPLYTGGAISAGIKMAEKETAMSMNGRKRQVNAVRMAIVTNYLELAKQRNLLKVYDENIRLTEKLLEEMRARHAQGIVLKNDITRYELRLSSLGYDRLAADNAIRICNANLVSLLRLDESTEIVPLGLEDSETGLPENWLQSALNNSPSLKAFSLQADMQRLGRRLAHSEYLPKIGLVIGDSFQGPITFEVPAINKNYNAWFAGVSVKWNISSLFTTPKATRQHDLEIIKIADEQAAAESTISRNITEARTLWQQSRQRVEIERKNLQLAEENYSVVSNRFDNQLALLTDMLDASNARLEAGVRLVNARISSQFYFYQLHFISGTLSTL